MDGARAKSAVQHCDIITWWSFEEETDDTPFKLHFRMGIRTKKCVNRRLHWAGAPDFVHCSSKKRIDPGVDHTQREHKHKDRKHGGGDYGDEEDDEYDSDSDYE